MIFSEKDYDEMTELGRVHFGGAKLAIKRDDFKEFLGIDCSDIHTSKCWNKLDRAKEINEFIKQLDKDGKLKKIPAPGGFDHRWAEKIRKSKEENAKRNK